MVGHAVHNDFQVLKYTHPRSHIRDTTCVPRLLSPGGPPKARVSLKDLALHLLHKKIQVWPGCGGPAVVSWESASLTSPACLPHFHPSCRWATMDTHQWRMLPQPWSCTGW